MRAILKIEALLAQLKEKGIGQSLLKQLMALYKDVYAEAYNDGQADIREQFELEDNDEE